MYAQLKTFLAPAPGSVRGMLNPVDLYRSIFTSLGSATVIGVLIVVVQAILAQAGTIFPNPTVASLATALLTLVLDLLRRQGQGVTPPSPTT